MRFPRVFNFLKWAGPALVGIILGSLATFAALGGLYPGVKEWGETIFMRMWPVVTALWFISFAIVAVLGYIGALVYTGGKTNKIFYTASMDEFMGDKKIVPAIYNGGRIENSVFRIEKYVGNGPLYGGDGVFKDSSFNVGEIQRTAEAETNAEGITIIPVRFPDRCPESITIIAKNNQVVAIDVLENGNSIAEIKREGGEILTLNFRPVHNFSIVIGLNEKRKATPNDIDIIEK